MAVAVARQLGATGTPIAIAQVVPTVGLLIVLALLLQLARAPFEAGTDGAEAALAVTVLLQGAGAAEARGTAPPPPRPPPGAAQPSGRRPRPRAVPRGPARWALSDGPLRPLRAHRRLRELAAQASAAAPTPAVPATPPPGPGRNAAQTDALVRLALAFVAALDADQRTDAPRT